jgi:hypothetical protein
MTRATLPELLLDRATSSNNNARCACSGSADNRSSMTCGTDARSFCARNVLLEQRRGIRDGRSALRARRVDKHLERLPHLHDVRRLAHR